jgi:hypothetical protein
MQDTTKAAQRPQSGVRHVTVDALEPRLCLAAGGYVSSVVFGGAGGERVAQLTVDAAGNRYALGTFAGTCDFAPGKTAKWFMTSAGGEDVFLAKYSPAGKLVWARQFGGGGDDQPGNVAVTAGQVYVAGGYSGTADFNPTAGKDVRTSAGASDAFVVRLSVNGKYEWARTAGAKSFDTAYDLALGPAGQVFVGGTYRQSAVFPGLSQEAGGGGRDGYVWALDSAGASQGFRPFRSLGDDAVTALAVAPADGRLFVAGHFGGGLTFGGGGFVNPVGADDAFVAAYDVDLALDAAHAYPASPEFVVRVADVAASATAAAAGPYVLLSAGDVGERQVVIWNPDAGTDEALIPEFSDTVAGAIVVGPGDALYVTGTHRGTFLGHPGVGAGTDGFVVRVTPDALGFAWSRSIGDVNDETGAAVALTAAGTVVIGGAWAGAVDFDPHFSRQQIRHSEGGSDAYLLELLA